MTRSREIALLEEVRDHVAGLHKAAKGLNPEQHGQRRMAIRVLFYLNTRLEALDPENWGAADIDEELKA